jgi:glycosyltransferase involved in cell wall biosynthesis
MKSHPLISTIMPVYDADRYLADAIESVLTQTYRPIELIVVLDPRSTDSSAEIAESFAPPVRCHYQSSVGLGAARNEGVAVAQGGLLAFLDADDLWVPEKLSLQMAALRAHPELDVVFGHVRQFLSPELDRVAMASWAPSGEPVPGYSTGCMLVRREALLRVGPFATAWRMGVFLDWYARARQEGLKCLMLSQVLMERRIHADNMGTRERHRRADYVHALKRALDRRRGREPPAATDDAGGDGRGDADVDEARGDS